MTSPHMSADLAVSQLQLHSDGGGGLFSGLVSAVRATRPPDRDESSFER